MIKALVIASSLMIMATSFTATAASAHTAAQPVPAQTGQTRMKLKPNMPWLTTVGYQVERRLNPQPLPPLMRRGLNPQPLPPVTIA